MSEKTEEGSEARKADPGVEIILGEDKHSLLYTLWSFCKLDEETGINPLEGKGWDNIRPKDLVLFIWVGLQHEDPVPSQEQIAKKIHLGQIKTLGPLIRQAVQNALPSDDEKKSLDELPESPAETPQAE